MISVYHVRPHMYAQRHGCDQCIQAGDAADDALRARQYNVSSELIEDINGKKFLCLTRKEVCVRRLLALQAKSHVNNSHADEGITDMRLTDVPDQLVTARQ